MAKKNSASVVSFPQQGPSISIEPVSLDITKAAAFLDTSVRQIRTLIYSRELIPVTIGKKQLLLVDDLRAFIQAKRRAA